MPEGYVVVEAPEPAYVGACSFCRLPVPFQRIEVEGGPFWGLQAMHELAGSDHLATWCESCGPRHRREGWVLKS